MAFGSEMNISKYLIPTYLKNINFILLKMMQLYILFISEYNNIFVVIN